MSVWLTADGQIWWYGLPKKYQQCWKILVGWWSQGGHTAQDYDNWGFFGIIIIHEVGIIQKNMSKYFPEICHSHSQSISLNIIPGWRCFFSQQMRVFFGGIAYPVVIIFYVASWVPSHRWGQDFVSASSLGPGRPDECAEADHWDSLACNRDIYIYINIYIL